MFERDVHSVPARSTEIHYLLAVRCISPLRQRVELGDQGVAIGDSFIGVDVVLIVHLECYVRPRDKGMS